MELEKVETNIEKTDKKLESLLADCKKRKRLQPANPKQVETLIAKAQYNLQVAESLEAEGYFDWAIIASYSAMFSAANAFTAKFANVTAKDHACIIALMLQRIKGKSLAGAFNKVRKSMEKEALSMEKIRRVRNTALYTVTEIDEKTARKCLKIASGFVEKIDAGE